MRPKFTPEHRDQLHNQTRAQLRNQLQHVRRSPPRRESDEAPHLTRRDARAQPRHKVAAARKNRHLVLTGVMALACAPIVIAVALATSDSEADASSVASQVSTAPAPTTAVTAPPAATPEPSVSSMVSTDSVTPIPEDGTSTGPVTGGTVVTLTGVDLDTVATVTFGANAGTVLSATETTITISTPAATDYGPGAVPVELLNAAGAPIVVAEGPAPTATPSPTATPAPAASADAEPLTFNYVPDPRITAQLEYVNAHWNKYNYAEYGNLSGNDCVNFTSQSLIERGWTMDAEWSFDKASNFYSPAWASSTAFAAYLTAHPERATPLTDAQRDQVKVGDIVQFDWDRSGDRDHTGIVTSVTKTDSGIAIGYAGHTANTLDNSVDESLANSGGTVSYFSVK